MSGRLHNNRPDFLYGGDGFVGNINLFAFVAGKWYICTLCTKFDFYERKTVLPRTLFA